MNFDIELRTQEAIEALTTGVIQLWEVLATYGEEVYLAVSTFGL